MNSTVCDGWNKPVNVVEKGGGHWTREPVFIFFNFYKKNHPPSKVMNCIVFKNHQVSLLARAPSLNTGMNRL